MDEFLKFLEDNCPGDDAHDGCAEPNKPLLKRCGLCASIYEAHRKEMNLQLRDWEKAVNAHCSCGGDGPGAGCAACEIYHDATGTKKREQEPPKVATTEAYCTCREAPVCCQIHHPGAR